MTLDVTNARIDSVYYREQGMAARVSKPWPAGRYRNGRGLEALMSTKSISRSMAFHSTEYILRYMLEVGPIFKYDYENLIIYLVIANSNIQGLMNSPDKYAPYVSINTIIPPELQRPVTRSAISRATGLPRETVRRKVAGMINSGLLTLDARGGLRLTPGILSTEPISAALEKNEANIRRFVRQVSPMI